MKHIILAVYYLKKDCSVNQAGLCTKTQSLVLHEISTSPDREWTFRDKLWDNSQPLRDPRQITSIMLNRFWSLSKNPFTPPHRLHLSLLFIMDNIRLHGMPTTSFEKVLLWKVTRYSYQFFSCFTSMFISADIIFTTF